MTDGLHDRVDSLCTNIVNPRNLVLESKPEFTELITEFPYEIDFIDLCYEMSERLPIALFKNPDALKIMLSNLDVIAQADNPYDASVIEYMRNALSVDSYHYKTYSGTKILIMILENFLEAKNSKLLQADQSIRNLAFMYVADLNTLSYSTHRTVREDSTMDPALSAVNNGINMRALFLTQKIGLIVNYEAVLEESTNFQKVLAQISRKVIKPPIDFLDRWTRLYNNAEDDLRLMFQNLDQAGIETIRALGDSTIKKWKVSIRNYTRSGYEETVKTLNTQIELLEGYLKLIPELEETIYI